MLKTIERSAASKLGGISATYRSGTNANMYGTCPTTCALCPTRAAATDTIDAEYFNALLAAVPRRGAAYTYTHFPVADWAPQWHAHRATGTPTTTINASADTVDQAIDAHRAGIPVVLARPAADVQKVERIHGVRFVQCPATRDGSDVTCATCGGDTPLCARADRDYVIVFPAHGATAKRVGTDTDGGCYASGGNVALHWRKMANDAPDAETDGERLSRFVKGLRAGSVLRHHIAGDIGQDKVRDAIPVALA